MDRETHIYLTRPFDLRKVKWRVGSRSKDKSKGMVLAYVDARDVMQRLDSVLGCANWQATYPMQGCCELSIRIDGEWVTKANFAGETQVEAEKGQASDAFKRAAVLWGIGRYLYYLDSIWVDLVNGYLPPNFNAPQMPAFADPVNWTQYYPKMFGEV